MNIFATGRIRMSEPGVVDFTNTATKPTKKRKSSENAKKKPASEPKKKKQKVPVVEAEGGLLRHLSIYTVRSH